MLAIWPSVYPSDPILDVLTVNGAPGAYNKNLGAGRGHQLGIPESGCPCIGQLRGCQWCISDTRSGGLPPTRLEAPARLQLGWEGDNWGMWLPLFQGSERS